MSLDKNFTLTNALGVTGWPHADQRDCAFVGLGELKTHFHSVAIGVIKHLVVSTDEPVGPLFNRVRGGRIWDLLDADDDLQYDSLFEIWRAMVTRHQSFEVNFQIELRSMRSITSDGGTAGSGPITHALASRSCCASHCESSEYLMVARVSPGDTESPILATTVIPTPGSITSSFRSRPAPSLVAAIPIVRASQAWTYPAVSVVITALCGATGRSEGSRI